MTADDLSRFTERQRAAWTEAVAEVQRYVDTSTVPEHLHEWVIEFEDETRPGRGHFVNAVWCDGEYMAQVRMDVYGYPSVSVGAVEWLHSSSQEDCPCAPCREADDDR